ncbi:MAG: hypothetical protein CL582_09650 [Alteromonadaceae bacterium]|nr:hypothetical protein [Alteromonadaceae bacterium]|tara:strand:- start:5122 stop:5535 length:414 start_codon:yes stop_codon:yes gene_type:complete
MKISKNASAVILSLVTGLSGLGTALINRHTPNEMAVEESSKVTRKGYRAMKSATNAVSEDVDILARRIDSLERSLALQNNVIEFLMSNGLSRTAQRKARSEGSKLKLLTPPRTYKMKRVPTKVRAIVPSFEAAQKAR